jgi:integrase/recombinase XerD
MSNKELVDLYFSSLSELSIETRKTRQYILNEFANTFQDKSILDLTVADIRNYIIKKKENGTWKKPGTIAVCITMIKMFYKFLVAEDHLSEFKNPARNVKSPRLHNDFSVRPLNAEEIRRLLKAVEAPIVSIKDKLIFYIAFTSGLRAKEISNIKKNNIDLNNKLIYLPKEDVKGQYRNKLVPISDRTKQLLEVYLIQHPTQSEYLFEGKRKGRMYRMFIHRTMKLIIDLAYPYKDTWNKPYGSHLARHTFATRWIESGGDVHALRAIMGWNSLAQVDRYVNVSSDYIRKAAMKVEKRLLKV